MRDLLHAALIVVLATGVLAQNATPVSTQEEHPEALCSAGGRVVSAADGKPLKSARVALQAEASGSKPSVFAVTSDNGGNFQFKNVPPGRYHFFATRDGFLTQDYRPNGSHGETLLNLKAGQAITDVLFRMKAASVITGRVTNDDGDPMVRVLVRALRKPEEDEFEDSESAAQKEELVLAASARTDDRGQYRIFGLKPGEYYIEAVQSFEPDRDDPALGGQGFWVNQQLGSEYAPSYYPGVTQTSQAQTVVSKSGSEVQAEFSMPRIKTVEVSGRVVGLEGPVKSASVNLEPAGERYDEPERDTSTDEQGNFRLEGVAPGSYFILVYGPRPGGDIYEEWGRQKIEVGTENLDSIMVTIKAGVPVSGHITVLGGTAPKSGSVHLNLSSVGSERWLGTNTRVKEDGSFEFPSVKPENYALFVWSMGHEWYVKSARAGADDVLEKGLDVEESPVEKIEIVLSPATAQLDGLVTNGDTPVAGARVVMARDPKSPYRQSKWQPTITDQNGRFSITGIPPGTYRVIARTESDGDRDSLKSDPRLITFSERDHKTVDLKIGKPQTE